jgi:hypothetical protein
VRIFLAEKAIVVPTVQVDLRHLVSDGVSRRHDLRSPADLRAQVADILPRAGALLRETGCDCANIVRVSLFLRQGETPDALLAAIAAIAPVPLEHAEIELVEGYSRPNKLIEIKITIRR